MLTRYYILKNNTPYISHNRNWKNDYEGYNSLEKANSIINRFLLHKYPTSIFQIMAMEYNEKTYNDLLNKKYLFLNCFN